MGIRSPAALDACAGPQWTGPSSIRIQSANQQRVLVVTGGGRHGAARKRASQALAPQGDPAVLLDLGGGLGCAFAMHDKSAGTLLLGRDAMGVMPLYVSIRADRIAFATEIGSFAALLDERPQIDGRVLAMYLDHGFNGGNRTALARVERVMPGELLRIGRDLRITRTYRRARLGATGGEGRIFPVHASDSMRCSSRPSRRRSIRSAQAACCFPVASIRP